MSKLFLLFSDVVSIGSATVASGQPVQRFRKELVRVGKYVKDNKTYDITKALLSQFLAEYTAMRLAGVSVPIMSGHSNDADNTRGNLVDMFIEGDVLVGILEVVGKEAILSATVNDVSIAADENYVDGKGTKYKFPITHIALTPHPVVPGLKPAVAFSLDPEKLADDPITLVGTIGVEKNEADEIVAINLAVGELVYSVLLTDFGQTLAGQDGKKVSVIGVAQEQDGILSFDVSAFEPVTEEEEPEAADLARKLRDAKMKLAIKSGTLTPAAAKKLEKIFASKETMTLSRTDVFDAVMDIVTTHKTVSGKSATSPQLLSNDRVSGDSGTSKWIEDKYGKSKE